MRHLREFLARYRRRIALGGAVAVVAVTTIVIAPAASAPRINLTAAGSTSGTCSWSNDASGNLNISCTPSTTPTTQPPATTTTTAPPATTTTTAPVSSAPPAVTNLKASVSGSTVTLTWTNNGSPPSETDGNDIYRDGTKIAWPGIPPVTSLVDSGVATGSHTYAVTAYNGHGEGPQTSVSVTVGSAPPPAASVLGLYNGSVSSATSLGNTLGLNPLKGYSYYCDGSTWSSISSCAPAAGLPAGTVNLVGLNLTPNGSVGDSAVSGELSVFQSVARRFVGTPTIFRLGWEFDGNWFSWGNGVNGNTPASFATATALVIPAMKAIDPTAQFDFSDNVGSSTVAQLKAYMGNNAALWNYVGGDHYDNQGGGGNASQMTAVVTYASQLGKPLSIGEWGLRGADDPAFINDMAQVILNPASASAANNWPAYTVGPTSYFNDSSYGSDITQYPKSEAAFKADFG